MSREQRTMNKGKKKRKWNRSESEPTSFDRLQRRFITSHLSGGYVQFKQSINDFPLMVKLGEKVPSWGLSRWGGNKGLRFVPFDDEGFTLQGDKRRLLYKGRRRSHRFTILGDTAFEYDCILAREPESNVISLRMEGAENFDFFRQPDFVKEPFLKGSYAVYKKETMVGEGTGKLCHIHRPEIIDARGRRCWGDLAVVGDEFRITVPEKWLSEAKYPVIVDPTIGTTMIGGQITGPDPNNSYYDRPMLDSEFALNKYLVPQNGNGSCTAFVYCYNTECDDDVRPCIYTNVDNKPYARKSMNEKDVNVRVWPPNWQVGWRNNTFGINENIIAGEYVWFGVSASYFTTRFDYGGECYKGSFNWGLYEDYIENYNLAPFIDFNITVRFCTIKWSWYFTYTAAASLNYSRTITQGVTLNDNLIKTIGYKRTLTQTAGIDTLLGRCKTIFQRIQDTVKNSDTAYSVRVLFRALSEKIAILSIEKRVKIIIAKIADSIHVTSFLNRSLNLFIRIVSGLFARDNLFARLLKAKTEVTIKSCVTREIVLESKIK